VTSNGNAGCFKKSFTMVFKMLLCGECYENVYTQRRTNCRSFYVSPDSNISNNIVKLFLKHSIILVQRLHKLFDTPESPYARNRGRKGISQCHVGAMTDLFGRCTTESHLLMSALIKFCYVLIEAKALYFTVSHCGYSW
jgi:hypothetical protein